MDARIISRIDGNAIDTLQAYCFVHSKPVGEAWTYKLLPGARIVLAMHQNRQMAGWTHVSNWRRLEWPKFYSIRAALRNLVRIPKNRGICRGFGSQTIPLFEVEKDRSAGFFDLK